MTLGLAIFMRATPTGAPVVRGESEQANMLYRPLDMHSRRASGINNIICLSRSPSKVVAYKGTDEEEQKPGEVVEDARSAYARK